jgi:phage terminase large subunit-like protein
MLSLAQQRLYKELDVPAEDRGKPSGAVIAFAHSLLVPAGPHVNRPLRLKPFQLAFIRDVYNRRDKNGRVTRQAVLSIARRNGKTLLASVVVLAHLVGPMRKPNATLVSAATTREQASIVFRFVRDMVRVNKTLRAHLKVIDSTRRILHRQDGSVYRAISAEAGGQFGLGLDLVVYDELGQAKNRALYDALMTSLGSQTEPLMMIISTQAASNEHLLSELIDYGEKVSTGVIPDLSFVCHLHSTPRDSPLMDEAGWYTANPGLGDYRSLEEMRTTMRRAEKIPSLENSCRVYYLNQRVGSESPFLSVDVWEACAGEIDTTIFTDGRPVYGGLDLSARADLTALVLAAADDEDRLHLWPFVWTPQDSLADRAERDRVPYETWVRQEQLMTTPGSTVDYDWVAAEVADITAGMNIARVNYDRWRIDIFRQALARQGYALPLLPFGQGYRDMSPAVEAFEEAALSGKLVHGGHPVLRLCVANAVVSRDPAGNRKLDKAKAYGRIDAAVAAVMAVGACKASGEPVLDVAGMIG